MLILELLRDYIGERRAPLKILFYINQDHGVQSQSIPNSQNFFKCPA